MKGKLLISLLKSLKKYLIYFADLMDLKILNGNSEFIKVFNALNVNFKCVIPFSLEKIFIMLNAFIYILLYILK